MTETPPFRIASNNIKYFDVSLTKQVKDLYVKNFNALKKEIDKEYKRLERWLIHMDQ